jgi:hypothetical protein
MSSFEKHYQTIFEPFKHLISTENNITFESQYEQLELWIEKTDQTQENSEQNLYAKS